MSNEKKVNVVKLVCTLLMLVVITALGAYAYLSWQSGDLSAVQGRDAGNRTEPVELKKRLRNALDGSFEASVTEEELNAYLAEKLVVEQGGLLGAFVDVKGVWVDLTSDHIEVFIEREIFSHNAEKAEAKLKPRAHTVSMVLEVVTKHSEKDGSPIKTVAFPRGKIGQAPAPSGLQRFVMDGFQTVREALAEEIELGYDSFASLRVEDGVIHFKPVVEANEL